MMDLFTDNNSIQNSKIPLADRMRPRDFSSFFGQNDIIGEGKLLRNSINSGNLQSLIFWGPPGSGKTTLARIIANITKMNFIEFSAVLSGIKEVKAVMEKASFDFKSSSNNNFQTEENLSSSFNQLSSSV